MRSSESSVPPVSTPPVNECPAPATRTGPAARPSAATSSSREPGRSIAAGSQRWVRDQLTHAATAAPYSAAGFALLGEHPQGNLALWASVPLVP